MKPWLGNLWITFQDDGEDLVIVNARGPRVSSLQFPQLAVPPTVKGYYLVQLWAGLSEGSIWTAELVPVSTDDGPDIVRRVEYNGRPVATLALRRLDAADSFLFTIDDQSDDLTTRPLTTYRILKTCLSLMKLEARSNLQVAADALPNEELESKTPVRVFAPRPMMANTYLVLRWLGFLPVPDRDDLLMLEGTDEISLKCEVIPNAD